MNFSFPQLPKWITPGDSVWLYFRDSGGDGQDLASQEAYGISYCHHYHLK